MRKSILAVSACAVLASSSYAGGDINLELQEQLKALKAQVEMLEKKLNAQAKQQTATVDEARIEKIEKKLARVDKTAKVAKIQSSGDNIKWDVDYRTSFDALNYKMANGDKRSNNGLLTNRLWLGMGYAPDDNNIFKGKLSYNKAFGDTANHSQSNTRPGYADFDWLTNENATDNTIKLKEAYWLYKNDTLAGADIPWTVSVGRRPSTDGLPINLRNDQAANSPLSHVVDVEFDGFSVKFDTEKLIGLKGSWFKICGGRGLTNATPRFDFFNEAAYSRDEDKNVDVDMLGFIAAPYDDGQYSLHINYAKAWNLIGFNQTSVNNFGMVSYGIDPTSVSNLAGDATQLDGTTATNIYAPTTTTAATNVLIPTASMAYAPAFKDVGDIDFFTAIFKSDGIGDGISDYLDNTIFFASYAMSKTNPNSSSDAEGMLGSGQSETGHSVWLGINAPCPIDPDDSRIGVEWNKGSKYWRSMTYAEDTMAGSKIAARGTAWEIYRNQKLTDALSWGISYTKIKYDYTGSNSFFGYEGRPLTMAEATAQGMNPVSEAEDIRTYIRYRF